VVILAIANLLLNGQLPELWAAVVTILAIVASGAVGHQDGLTLRDLGLAASATRRGLLFGVVGAGAVGSVVALALALDPSLFRDARVDNMAVAGLAAQVGLRIPLATAVGEELLFRGVLLALLLRRLRPCPAVVASSVVFGLWHIAPTLGDLEGNEVASSVGGSTVGRIAAVAAVVVATTAAGCAFSWLRLRSGSLVAPILVHWSVNGSALVAAWLAARH
jgi:membrane protease YdiL (CAAX protease family)